MNENATSITGLHGAHAGADLLDDACTFVTAEQGKVLHRRYARRLHDRRKVWCGNHIAGGEVVVGMADPGDRHLHQHLAVFGRVERDLPNLPVLADTAQDGPLTLQRAPPRGLRPTRRRPCAAAARTTPIANRVLPRE